LPFKDQPHGQGNAFNSPLRDQDYGRIYRIVYKGAKNVAPMKLSKEDLPGLLAGLKSDNKLWRMHAQRLLVESKNQNAVPGLLEIVANQQVDEIGLNSPAVHAIWTLDGLGATDGSNVAVTQALEAAMKHPAAGVRKAAVQVFPKNHHGILAIDKQGVLNDKNLNTRLAAFVSLAELDASDHVGELLFKASQNQDNGTDKWLSQALFGAAVKHRTGFRKAAEKAGAAQKASLTGTVLAALDKEFPIEKPKEPVKVAEKVPAKAPVKEAAKPAPAKARTIVVSVVKDIMQFDKKLINLKAGEKISLRFENPDGMLHNLLIIKPGTLNKVGAAADAMLRDPKAADKHYVPSVPEVLFATKLLSTGQSVTLEFTVPGTPGDYPFVCTFPGHWRGMNGIMRVTK